ncbi:4Fe-4S double cluster binding domain-containing protein [Pelotomaculum propionicicum]|uniref:4Fe-4S double cluster binding domain-containing protein n=1 Tax=Pelotomaculum propionicicum TaxID=258475 RepID=UPI003B7F0C59
MILNKELKDLADSQWIDYFGVADLKTAREVVLEQGGPEAAGFPYAVSLGIVLNQHLVDQLPRRNEKSVALNYKHHASTVIYHRLDTASSIIAGYIDKKGYRALPLPASERINDERLFASFSHIMAAHLAGLGWIGKNCLLVTPQYGPRVNWTTILTDAPLEPTGKLQEQKCGRCNRCVDICPLQALTGRPFVAGEPREARYDAEKCDNFYNLMKSKGEPGVCGMCLYVCPHGNKKTVKS